MKATASGQPKQRAMKALPAGAMDLSIALCKARAARILLRMDDDYLQMPFSMTAYEEQDVRGWIKIFAFDALGAALEQAKAAGEREHVAPTRKAVA